MKKRHETNLKHFEMFEIVSSGMKLIPSERISTTQNYPKHPWGAAKQPSRAPRGISLGWDIEIVSNGINVIPFETI